MRMKIRDVIILGAVVAVLIFGHEYVTYRDSEKENLTNHDSSIQENNKTEIIRNDSTIVLIPKIADEYAYDYEYAFDQVDWYAAHDLNPEYVGNVHFDSGLMSFDLVENDLQQNDEGESGEYDFPFLLPGQFVESDQNIVIHGYFGKGKSKKLLNPLTEFVHQKNYDLNKTFTVYFENTVRHYLISAVLEIGNGQVDDLEKYNFETEVEWNRWVKDVQNNNMITAPEQLEYNDKMVTIVLQNANKSDQSIVIIAKEIDRYEYYGNAING